MANKRPKRNQMSCKKKYAEVCEKSYGVLPPINVDNKLSKKFRATILLASLSCAAFSLYSWFVGQENIALFSMVLSSTIMGLGNLLEN